MQTLLYMKCVNEFLFHSLHLSFASIQIRYKRPDSSAVGHLRISQNHDREKHAFLMV